jgi:hypothetical protein
LIARRRDDAPFAGSADGDRPVAEIRIVPLLDGSIERVQMGFGRDPTALSKCLPVSHS